MDYRNNNQVSTTSTSNNDTYKHIEKSYKKCAGTTDLGNEYEHFFLVHLCLKLIADTNIEKIFLSSNNEKYGDFDDVVIEIEHQDRIDKYGIQLKHQENEKTTLTQLIRQKKFKKYFASKDKNKDFKSLAPVKMILFTNIKLEVPGTEFKLKTDSFELNVKKQKSMELITTSTEEKNHYIFNTDDNNISYDFKEYLEHLYLYSNQLNVTQLKKESLQMFQNLFKSDESDAFKKFVSFITEWSMIDKEKDKLDKTFLRRVITLCVLTPFIKPLTISNTSELSQNAVTFREAISKFHVTRLSEDNYDIIKNLWSNVLNELQNLVEVNKVIKTYQLSVEWITSTEQLKRENIEICKLLWLLGKCPLVVKGCPQVYQIIKACHQKNFIILDSEENFSEGVSQIQDNISTFNSLYDLKDGPVYEDVLNKFTYSIEGQKEESLESLLEINEEFAPKFTTDKLVQMLKKPLLIGKQKEVLPPSHIERTLTRILIDFKFLKNLCSDSVTIVSCIKNLEDVKTKLEDTDIIEISDDDRVNWDHLKNEKNDKLVYISKNKISEKLFKTLRCKHSAKTVHHLRYLNYSCLEWISSQRKEPSFDTPNRRDCFHELEKFRLENENNTDAFPESELFNDTSNNINVICANPGMGKTTLMKSLKNNSSSRLWTIMIYSRGHALFFRMKNNNAEDFMKYIYNQITKEYNEDLHVFEGFWKKKEIQIIWDGLDEVSDATLEAILSIVSDISKEGIKQWLTARINLRDRLEERFHVFSRNLNKLNKDEQKRYVRDRLEILNTNELDKIFKLIDNNIRSFSNSSILEIPLQIYMLTQLLGRDRDNYLTLLNTTFTILDLYEHFVEEKLIFFYVNKLKRDLSDEGNQQDYIKEKNVKIEFYKTVAYNLHFGNTLDVDADILNEIKQSGDRIGFIINVNKNDNNNFEFFHNSFGEYFAALYLYDREKYKARDSEFIFDSKYNNIRFFLDLMLSAKSKAFVAVLYKNSQLLRECTEDDLKVKDNVGRDVLELSCGWCKQYPFIEINEFKFEKISALEKKNTRFQPMYAEHPDRLTTNETNNLKYESISKNVNKIENILPLSLKKVLLLLPFLILFYKEKRERLFNFNVLYYTIKFDLEIIFDCFQDSNTLANAYYNIDKTNYLSLVLAHNSKTILEKIMMETNYQNVLLKSVTIVLDCDHSINLSFISSLFHLPNINSYLNLIPIHYACQKGWFEIVKNLINLNVKLDIPDSNGLMPIHYACRNKRWNAPEVVQLLINSKIKLDVPDSNGLMPIHYACQNTGWKGDEIVQLLINSKIKLDIPDSNGLMPIHYACRNKRWNAPEVVQLLINSKIRLDVPDSDGLMPIHYACRRGWIGVVNKLINLNVKLDVPDSNGLMPIHYACQNEGEDALKIVQLLINSKIKLDVPDSNGLMPIHYARLNRK